MDKLKELENRIRFLEEQLMRMGHPLQYPYQPMIPSYIPHPDLVPPNFTPTITC